jgi:DNA polymerase-3 subunit epsilon
MALDPRAPWWDQPLAILDFETTGPDPAVCEPVSVAVVRFEQGIERDAFYTLLRPTIPIPPEATAIHGITDALAAHAPTLLDVAGELARVGKDALPVGYNAIHFDRPILHRYITGTDCPLFDPAQGWADPLVIVRKVDRYVGGKGSHRLAQVCARWGCPMDKADQHNALGDVRAVGRLLGRLVDKGLLRTGTTLQRLTDYTLQQANEQQRDFERYLARKMAEAAQQDLDLGGDDGSEATAGDGAGPV